MTSARLCTSVFIILLTAYACGEKNAGTAQKNLSPTTSVNQAANPTATATSGSGLIVSAIEPFELLTETAFSATPLELDKSVATAVSAVNSIQTSVSAEVNARLQTHLEAIRRAKAADNRADLAIASIEAFKEVVNAVPERTAAPADVSLLDYAGLRYDSDAQAKPPRWDDMLKATSYARERVAALSPAVPAAKLLPRMTAAITAMERAVKARDIAAARTAAKAELDLVDALEQAFAPAK